MLLRVILVLALCHSAARGAQHSCPSTQQDRASLLATAEHLMTLMQLHSALACGEKLAALFPLDAVGFDVLARVCFLGGDNACCVRFSEKCAMMHPPNSVERARSQVRKANCHAASEDWSSALTSYTDASSCALLPTDELATAYNNLGNVHRMLQQNQDAIASYLAAASLAPAFADAHFNAGGLLVEAGQVAEGTSALWASVGAEPASAENWRALAGALEGQGSSLAARAFRTDRKSVV